MNWNNIWQTILSNLGAIGGGGVIIIGISSWLGTIWANRLTEKYRSEYAEKLSKLEAEHAKALSELEKKLSYKYESRLQTEQQLLQVETTQNSRFLEKQFHLYIDLWSKLQKLRRAGDNLWVSVNEQNLIAFADAYRDTNLLVDDAGVVMSENIHQQVNKLLAHYSEFQVGKKHLMSMHTENEVKNARTEFTMESMDGSRYFDEMIRQQIKSNRFHKNEYERINEQIRKELQEKLATTSYATIFNRMMQNYLNDDYDYRDS